jgi:hypothetical protein
VATTGGNRALLNNQRGISGRSTDGLSTPSSLTAVIWRKEKAHEQNKIDPLGDRVYLLDARIERCVA